MKQLVILAGGRGTRLAGALGNIPKPLACVAGRPVLEHQLDLARTHGFTDVHLLTCYRTEAIERHFGNGSRFGISVHYHVEIEPRGTAGAVLAALPSLHRRFAVLYGDTVLDVDLDRIWRFHVAAGADATLFVHPNDHPHDSDLVEIDEVGQVRAFHAHPRGRDVYLPNIVNAALYVVEKDALKPWAEVGGKLDFAHDLFPRMLAQGARLYGYRSREYIKDMGTPERLARVEADCRSGLLARLSLRAPCPAVFLDRDGTLNVEVERVRSHEQLELIAGVGEAVRRLNREGLLAVLVTNQPVIARGDCSEEDLVRIHNKLETLLGAEGAYLDGIYHCPHHPDTGFPGERVDLKILCSCRKPNVGLIERAVRDLNICLNQSWMIGDSTTDLQTARNAGVRAVLVRTGHGGRDRRWPIRPDYEFHQLNEAVDFITRRHSALLARARTMVDRCAPGDLIAMGGLSRSGKSTWASVLREALAERGLKLVVIPLDTWLKSWPDRRLGHVLQRYHIDGVEDAVSRLSRRTGVLEIALGGYDRSTRLRYDSGEVAVIGPDDITLVEGVPALALESLRSAAALRLYVDCQESVRYDRFVKEYRLRGLRDDEIVALYRERELDEHPFVKSSAASADITIADCGA